MLARQACFVNGDVILGTRQVLVLERAKCALGTFLRLFAPVNVKNGLAHSQLMPISASTSMPRPAIFGMSFTRSMYAALHPVPKMTAILVFGFT